MVNEKKLTGPENILVQEKCFVGQKKVGYKNIRLKKLGPKSPQHFSDLKKFCAQLRKENQMF